MPAMIAGMALVAALALPIQVAALVGGAKPPETAARLSVRAPSGCTSRDDLINRVVVRSRIHFDGDDSAVSVEASFAADGAGGVTASLSVLAPGGKSMVRSLKGSSCTEVADAVAVIIAVTLDPAANGEQRDGQRSEGTGSSAGGASPGSVPSASPARSEERTPPAPPTQPSLGRAEPLTPEPAPSRPRTVGARGRAGVHLAGQAVAGPAPAVMPGVAVYGMAALDRDSWWSPAVFLGVVHASRGGFVETGGTAAFVLDVVNLDGCPLRLRLSVMEARACASAMVGRFEASGSDTLGAASRARPFAALGAAAVVAVRLTAVLEMVLRVGGSATLLRDWYVFGPTEFHRARGLTTAASLGLGVRWP
jgi:hypothetical protein